MRVLITRRLAIDPRPLLGPEAVIDQLEGERAPVRELLLERARESHALLSMVVDKIDAELLDQSPPITPWVSTTSMFRPAPPAASR